MIELLKKKFSIDDFSMSIEKRVIHDGISYMDALVSYSDDHDLGPSAIGMMVKKSEAIRSKLEAECRRLNLLERHAQLPNV